MTYYAASEYDHYIDHCEDNGLDTMLFTLEDYREKMWDAENERRFEAFHQGF